MMRSAACWIVLAIVLGGVWFQPSYALEPAVERPSAAPQSIPFKRERATDAGSVHHVLLITLLAAAVAVGCALLVRKYLQQRGLIQPAKTNRITILDTRRVSPKLTIFLISVDGRNYIVTQSSDRTTLTPTLQNQGDSIYRVPHVDH
jgi:flagellar biogenesis protein FliO